MRFIVLSCFFLYSHLAYASYGFHTQGQVLYWGAMQEGLDAALSNFSPLATQPSMDSGGVHRPGFDFRMGYRGAIGAYDPTSYSALDFIFTWVNWPNNALNTKQNAAESYLYSTWPLSPDNLLLNMYSATPSWKLYTYQGDFILSHGVKLSRASLAKFFWGTKGFFNKEQFKIKYLDSVNYGTVEDKVLFTQYDYGVGPKLGAEHSLLIADSWSIFMQSFLTLFYNFTRASGSAFDATSEKEFYNKFTFAEAGMQPLLELALGTKVNMTLANYKVGMQASLAYEIQYWPNYNNLQNLMQSIPSGDLCMNGATFSLSLNF